MSSLQQQIAGNSTWRTKAFDAPFEADEFGFPVESFHGLWYFTRDENGDFLPNGVEAAGPFYDGSGNGNHMSILRGENPTKQSWGLEITDDDGILLDSGIAWPSSGTAIVGIQSQVSPAVNHHMAWLRPAAAGVPASLGDSVGGWAAPHPSLTTTESVVDPDTLIPYGNTHGLIDFDKAQLGVTRLAIPAYQSPADGHVVACFRWHGPSGRADLITLNGWLRYTATAGYWDTWLGDSTLFGIIPFSTQRPCKGNLYAAALATSALSDDIVGYAMRAIAELKSRAAGVDMSGHLRPAI